MSEFTKGKWILDKDGIAIFSDTEDCYIAELSPANSDEQVVANARLIVAAPELYELVKDFCDEVEAFVSIYDNFPDEFTSIAERAQEVLERIDEADEVDEDE